MFKKTDLLKMAQDVREHGVTTSSHKDLIKKASEVRIVSLLAAIKK